MESEKGLQEFRCSDSDKRKKLDGFTVFGTGRVKDMKDANIGQKDLKSLESEPKYDLRKSLAWDSAFFTSPGFLEPEELFRTLCSWDNRNGCDILGYEQHQLLSAKFLESEMRSTNECNTRKSLAWDNAFLTSEGVLNPQELSLVNKGFRKSEVHTLSAIEELRMSSQSNCTTDSDGSSLASLELELFEDGKASMHQSSKPSGAVASSFKQVKYRDMQKVHPMKKMEMPPQLKVKSLPNSRRQIGKQSEKISKEATTPSSRQSGEFDPSSSLKPPKILGRVKSTQMAPTKRVSLVANDVNQAINGKSNPGNTFSDFSSTPSSKLSLLSHPCTMTESTVLCSPYSSPLKSSGSKSDSPNSNSPDCNYTLTTSSKYRTKGTCRRVSIDTDGSTQSDKERQPHDQINVKLGGERCTRKSPYTEEKGSNSVPFLASRNTKPSSLRMPSAKIGYFDEESSLVLAEGQDSKSHSGVQNGVPKVGIGNINFNGYANRSRPGKVQTSRALKDIRSTKVCSEQTRRSTMSGTMKSTLGLAPVSKARSYSHRNSEAEFGVESCARIETKGGPESLKNKMTKEREGQFYLKANGAKTIYTDYEQHMHCDSEKENLTGFQHHLEGLNAQVRTIDVSGDVVIELN